MKRVCVIIVLMLLTLDVWAAPLATYRVSRFTPYRPSFMLFGQETYDRNGVYDDSAIEARYSFQYILLNCNLSYIEGEGGCPHDERNITEISLSYTGEFDFYMGTRYSGPVINRLSNPALNLSVKIRENGWKSHYLSLSKLGLSLEHRSNGQVTDVYAIDNDPASSTYGSYLTQIALDNGDHEYFDGLSRGANYWEAKARLHVGPYSNDKDRCDRRFSCVNVWLGYKYYISDDSAITWGALAGSDTRFADYDRVNVIVSDTRTFAARLFGIEFSHLTVEADYTIGDESTATDSVDYNVILPVRIDDLYIPLFYRHHYGPMDRLSDYTRVYTSDGVGLLFTY